MTETKRTKTRRTRLFTGLILVLGLLPTVAAVKQAMADPPEEEGEETDGGGETPSDKLSKRRKAVLAGIPRDEAVLINVTAREMPSSPDILNLGKRGARALARCVSDNVTDALRIKCASMLGRLGDKSALPALQGALEAWDPGVRSAAIDALRRMPDPSSFEPLKKLLEREDQADHWADVLLALGSLSDTRAMKVVREHLRKADGHAGDLRPTAFTALWKSRHLMARGTLVEDVTYALKAGTATGAEAAGGAQLALEGAFAAAELRAPDLVPALIPLMQHANPRIHNRAVYALGRIGNKAATAALLAQIPKVREARMLNNIAFALERLDPGASYATARSLIEHRQASIRMNAAFVLGDVHRPEGLPFLKKSLEDKNDYVRVSAVAALGKIDAPEALPLLEPLTDDQSSAIREEAVLSVLALSHGARTDLVRAKLLPSKNAATKHRALLALGKAGDQQVAGELLKCLEDAQCKVSDVEPVMRTATEPDVPGRLLLAWARGRMDLTDLVASRRPTGTGAIAVSDIAAQLAHGHAGQSIFAIDLSGDVGEQSAVKPLRALLGDDSTRLRLHAAASLARLDVTDADAVLLRDLDNLPQDRLPAFARLLGRVAEAPARKRLDAELDKRARGADIPIALAAAAVRLEWEPESAIFRFLDGLAPARGEERDLAQRYLVRSRRVEITWLLRRALARETREDVKDRLRKILDARAGSTEAEAASERHRATRSK